MTHGCRRRIGVAQGNNYPAAALRCLVGGFALLVSLTAIPLEAGELEPPVEVSSVAIGFSRRDRGTPFYW